MSGTIGAPVPLRQYALLADGERGALIGPRGDVAFLCAPQWHDDAVFSSLFGGAGSYSVTPRADRFVWGGSYDQDTLIWRSRWVATDAVIECREALAFPGERSRVVLLRRVEASLGDAHVRVGLDCRAGFGAHQMTARRSADGVWEGQTGDLRYRWSGVPDHARPENDRLLLDLDVPEGGHHDLVLEISREPLPAQPPHAPEAWERTAQAWEETVPDLSASIAPGESHHSYAVLRGLTASTGAMVAAATTALPERADAGRNYDYRYAWIRDQCFAGQAAAQVGGHDLLDAAIRFVSERVLADGAQLKPAYTVDGDPVPDERRVPLPGYPGAPVRVGNHANKQFQLDAFGESLLLLSAADRAGRLDDHGAKAIEVLVDAIEERRGDADAGIWELGDRRWAHSRLICAAGLRAAAGRRGGSRAEDWQALADQLVASVDRDCLHPDGYWQRAPDDPGVDGALLLPGIRGRRPGRGPAQPAHGRGGRGPAHRRRLRLPLPAGPRPTAARGRGRVPAVRVPPLARRTRPGRRARRAALVRAQPGGARPARPLRRGVRRDPAPAAGQPAAGVRARGAPGERVPPRRGRGELAWVLGSRAVSRGTPGGPQTRTDQTNPGRPKTTEHDETAGGRAMSSTRVVVVTGASGGIGRAAARKFAERGDSVALLARGTTGLDGVTAEVEKAGARALPISVDMSDHHAVEKAAQQVEDELGRDRRVGQRRVHLGLRAVQGHRARGVRAGHRRDLPRLRQRHPRGAEADAGPRPGHDRAGRLGAGPPGHPAAVGVLRRQARPAGLPRVAAHRAACTSTAT